MELEKNISSNVYYCNLKLSVFKNFPQITITLNDFGIIGIPLSKGDTLVSAMTFDSIFDLTSIFKKGNSKQNRLG